MIAGSLFVLIGVQVWSFGIFTALAGNPIKQPRDRLTQLVLNRLNLERGATVGFLVGGLGAGYALSLAGQWIASGFTAVPVTTEAVLAFTLLVLGVQAIFAAFFFSAVQSR
jgi:hypothetical protein